MMFVNISTQKINRSSDIEVYFIPLTIITGCSMAFAHGANDIANLISPLSIIVHSISNEASAVQIYNLPVFYYFLGSLGIIVGMATLGFRVVKTVGTHITTLTPSKAFCASLAAYLILDSCILFLNSLLYSLIMLSFLTSLHILF